MDIDEFVGFTAREKYIRNAYRDRDLSKPSRYTVRELTVIIPSLLFVGLYFWYEDVTLVFVGYALLLWHLVSGLKQNPFYLESYRSIFSKYEAKIKELAEVQQEEE
ncbi:MAG: hypothetical protein KME45_17070 [Stenomitos rutilans HA7619-LM2]|jgi:hypothetical protein|nr:hypothetical protein [Stenomitos rutilans HA7619-LM2]